eukprot:301563-Pyramimonas_sp.AAC.2
MLGFPSSMLGFPGSMLGFPGSILGFPSSVARVPFLFDSCPASATPSSPARRPAPPAPPAAAGGARPPPAPGRGPRTRTPPPHAPARSGTPPSAPRGCAAAPPRSSSPAPERRSVFRRVFAVGSRRARIPPPDPGSRAGETRAPRHASPCSDKIRSERPGESFQAELRRSER